ncbi:MAG: DUF952 domain-containing protein [Chloroflexi bacterium]|nr:DUF952 domain-containing protein [Chloroflexota bacterium]
MAALIYHIAALADWNAARASGVYRADSLETQGFIHCSSREQVVRVADAVFRGQRDLLLLAVDPHKLTAQLRFEPPDPSIPAHHYEGELFPHIYGALNAAAVVRVAAFLPRADGTFAFPQELES